MMAEQLSLEGHCQVVALLFEKGAVIDQTDIEGRTPLLCASLGGHYEIARLLIEKGASIDLADNGGQTTFFRHSSINATMS